MNSLFFVIEDRDIKYFLFISLCLFVMYRIFRFIRGQEEKEELEQERKVREQERRRLTGTKKTCERCQKSFKIPSVEDSWYNYSLHNSYYRPLKDVRFCCELHYKEYLKQKEIKSALKRIAAEQKWTEEHTFTCAWCKEKFISRDKSDFCGNLRCNSERRFYEKHLK